jgi:hypothetical protein
VIDVETGQRLYEKAGFGDIGYLDWHPDGDVLAVGDNTDRVIRFWDTRTGASAGPPLVGHAMEGVILRFNHAGDRLISNDWSGLLRLWDTHTGRQLLSRPAQGTLLQFSRDDRRLAADVSATSMRLFRLRNGREFRTVQDHPGAKPRVVYNHGRPCLDASGRLLAVQGASGVLLVDVTRGEEAGLLPIPGNGPLRFDAADGSLWTYGTSGLLRWPIATDPGDATARRVGPSERLAAIAMSDLWGSSTDGKLVAIPNHSLGALLWRHAPGPLESLHNKRMIWRVRNSPTPDFDQANIRL